MHPPNSHNMQLCGTLTSRLCRNPFLMLCRMSLVLCRSSYAMYAHARDEYLMYLTNTWKTRVGWRGEASNVEVNINRTFTIPFRSIDEKQMT